MSVFEGQRAESRGRQDPSDTGLSIIQLFLYIDSTEEVVNLFEVELQKPRNLRGRMWNSNIIIYNTEHTHTHSHIFSE